MHQFTILLKLALIHALVFTSALVHSSEIEYDSDHWNQFIAGTLEDIPNAKVREYLFSTHQDNPHAAKIFKLNEKAGVFSPNYDYVFWLPSIDLPVSPKEFRFLSSSKDVPSDIKKLIFYKKNGSHYLRMFIHPFSTEISYFKDLAIKHGGFKYEFQAATTASTRSFVAWPVKTPVVSPEPYVDFPRDSSRVFKTKVSVYSLDVEGSRLNPAKKMVRAFLTSQIFGSISSITKERIGFDFERDCVSAI